MTLCASLDRRSGRAAQAWAAWRKAVRLEPAQTPDWRVDAGHRLDRGGADALVVSTAVLNPSGGVPVGHEAPERPNLRWRRATNIPPPCHPD